MGAHITDRLKRIELFPTLPHIVGEVMGNLAGPYSSASDLVRHMDPSLIGEVLKVAKIFERYLLKAHAGLFETAYDQLRRIDSTLEQAPRTAA